MEIRVHGRGGQGGVTAAKILAALYAREGKSVQAFGDYAAERSGAPVRAYARVDDNPITNRNKVYHPDHLMILDESLIDDQVLSGLAAGGTLLINSTRSPDEFAHRFPGHRVATLDATGIAKRHAIGSRSLVVVNTTLAGAYVRVFDIAFENLEEVYGRLGLTSNLAAAREGHESVRVLEVGRDLLRSPRETGPVATPAPVIPLVDHREGPAPGLRTGNWKSQLPQYVTPEAPCISACPAGNDVVGFVQALATEGEQAAAEILARTTPLAGVCGRVCPGYCMDACSRSDLDGAVNVRALERWVADHVRIARPDPVTLPPERRRRIAVVGSGPAGLTAAYSLVRSGHSAVIFEADSEPGGVLRYGIPEYRLPQTVLHQEIEGLVTLGVELRCGKPVDREGLAELEQKFDTVIVATGLQRSRSLDNGFDGVEQGLEFLGRIKRGEGSALGGHVVVLGGGNTAIDCARSAVRCGALKVTRCLPAEP